MPLANKSIHPKFMTNLVQALNLATNLRTFTCVPNILPALLLPLKDHESLEGIRVNATLTVAQAKLLTSLSRLKTIALDACSWNMVDVLPEWTRKMSSSLTCLVLHVSELLLP